MRTWKDEKGREWSVSITLPVIEELRAKFAVDVIAWENPPFDALFRDPMKLYGVLWLLTEKQAAAAGVNAEQFAEGCCGGAFDRGLHALCEASTDFCPERTQSLRRSLLSQAAKLGQAAEERQLLKLHDPAMESQFFAALDKLTGSGPGALDDAINTGLERWRAKRSATSANESAT